MLGLLKNCQIVRHNGAVAAGTTAINPTGVDMAGYNSALFIVALGAITATGVPALKLQQSADNSTFEDLTGSAIAVTDADGSKYMAIEVVRPNKQYVRCAVTRTTANVVVDGIVCILSNPVAKQPLTITTLGNKQLVSPIAGTA